MKIDKARTVVNKVQKIKNAVGILIAGIAAIVIGAWILNTVLSTPDREPNTEFFPIIVIAIGAILAVIGVLSIIFTIKKNDNDFNKVNMSKVSQDMIDSVKNSTEETKDYIFHFYGKMNYSYILETADKKPVVEMQCTGFSPIKGNRYSVINHVTSSTKEMVMGLVTSTTTRGTVTKSTFKVDGKDVFDVIADMGYSFETRLEGIKLNYDILKYGVKVGELIAGGANLASGKSLGKLGNLPTKGVFSVKAKESDLDAVMLIAYTVSKIEIN